MTAAIEATAASAAGPATVVEAVNPAVGSASKTTTTNAVVSLAFSIRPG
jgi:hypothetical protein